MRSAVISAPEQVEVITCPAPVPDPGEVRVRIEGCGICGSDLPVWEGRPWFNYPAEPGRPGHEAWGRIDAVGGEVRGLSVGDRVAFLSSHGYAEYDLAPAADCVPLPPSLDHQPFPGEPLACAMNVLRRSRVRAGQTVAVVGVGFLGAVLTRLMSRSRVRVIALSRRAFALDTARRCGAFAAIELNDPAQAIAEVAKLTGGLGCDTVIEATGRQAPLDIAGEITGTRGRSSDRGLSPGWAAPSQPADVELEGSGRDQRARARSRHVRRRDAGRAAGRAGPAHRSSPLLHAHLSARAAAGRLRGAPRPTGRVPESAGARMSPTGPAARLAPIGPPRAPRVGFLGLGWIGHSRLEVLQAARAVEVVGVSDVDPAAASAAAALAGGARVCRDLDDLIAQAPEGIVIATPSVQHAEQAIRALSSGCAVFCQKPLALDAAATGRVVEAARRSDRLLGVDLSYRHTRGMRRVRELIAAGAIGRVYAAELVFHNSYGPDKAWYYDPDQAGGGCVLDLGIHLADLALWTLGYPRVERVNARLMSRGARLQRRPAVEDYAAAQIDLADGTTVLLTCSWNLPAGCDAVIRAEFFGTDGGLSFTNRDGSFFEFRAERHYRNKRERLCAETREDWWGAAALEWARRLGRNPAYDPAAESLRRTAEFLDSIYASAFEPAVLSVTSGTAATGFGSPRP